MPSVLGELQCELIVAHRNDGLASARACGRVYGYRPKRTADQAELAQQLYDAREKTVQQLAVMFDVPRSTVYGHLNKTKTRAPPAEEDRRREGLKASGELPAPWCPSCD
ncbi:hypothetical protein U9R90_19160 [Streptomyces sp. E11-3]|uniref:hypothetical protein n=1 Tax=Streptomyces sp. E11-3 TaxID=3110112 RepID=UPI00397F2C52